MVSETNYYHFFDPSIIRTYDIRGVVGVNLFAHDCYYLGRAFATKLSQDFQKLPQVVVGYDGRKTSKLLVDSLKKGLVSCGAEIGDIGLCATPQLYYATYRFETVAGIMVTGSHNPPDHNGLKIMVDQAPFYGNQLKKIAHMMNEGDFKEAEGHEVKQFSFDIHQDYLEFLLYNVGKCKKFRVAWDPGNGSAAPIINRLASELPGEHIVINSEVNGAFPSHSPDPTVPENLAQLIKTVLTHHCDFGFAFDGDGDRIVVVDRRGQIIWGDLLLLLFIQDLAKNHQDMTVVTDVKSSNVLFNECKKIGVKVIRAPTGHSIIKNRMVEEGALIAGEISGHMFFADRYYGYDDGIYTAIRVIELLSRSDYTLESFYDSLPHIHNTQEIRIKCSDSRKAEVVSQIKYNLLNNNINFDSTDGIRVDYGDAWWLIRPSNTEDALVLRCEANSKTRLLQVKLELQQFLARCELVCQF